MGFCQWWMGLGRNAELDVGIFITVHTYLGHYVDTIRPR